MSERLKTVLLCAAVSAGVSAGIWLLFDAVEDEGAADFPARPAVAKPADDLPAQPTVADPPALGLGQTIVAKSVTAETFLLLDAAGLPRAVLGMGPEGDRPSLSFGDREGMTRITLCLTDKDMPLFVCMGRDGRERLRLVVQDDLPYQVFTDNEHRGRIILGISDGVPAVALVGADPGTEACLTIIDEGPSFYFRQGNILRMALGHTSTTDQGTGRVTKWPVSTLHLYGSDGLVKWRAP